MAAILENGRTSFPLRNLSFGNDLRPFRHDGKVRNIVSIVAGGFFLQNAAFLCARY